MELKDVLKKVGAIIEDSHVVYTSGKHGGFYINKDALYPHTAETSAIAQMMAEKYKNENIDAIVGPALGGIILSQWVAHHLSVLHKKEILSVYAEKGAEQNVIFTRGYDTLVQKKNVLVVEDVTNTGGSTKKVIDAVKNAGGNVIAACVMVNRSPKTVTSETMGAPFSALMDIEAEAFDEADCPLCKDSVPINTEVGHGRKYLERKNGNAPVTSNQ
jgi:orotate phosphoribosyltransferase